MPEHGDHLPEDEEHDGGGDREDGGRVGEGGADLVAELRHLLDVGGEAVHHGMESAAGLARGDQVHVEVVEGPRPALHRLGEAGPGFDFGADLQQDGAEPGVLALDAQDVQALEQRQARVQQDGQLAAEDGERLRPDAAAGA